MAPVAVSFVGNTETPGDCSSLYADSMVSTTTENVCRAEELLP